MGKRKKSKLSKLQDTHYSKLANLGVESNKMLTVGFYLARAIIDFIRNGKTAQKIQTGFFCSLVIDFLVETN